MGETSKEFTIIVVGDSGIGKTCLVQAFLLGSSAFSDVYITTPGAEISKKKVTINKEQINLKIWDLSGANEYRTQIACQFKDADGVMLCYSVTKDESWENIDNWIKNIRFQIGDEEFKNINKLLVGLKYDLSFRIVSDTDVAVKCSLLPNADALVTSAKKSKGTQEAFERMAQEIYNRKYSKPRSPVTTYPNIASQPQKTMRCFII